LQIELLEYFQPRITTNSIVNNTTSLRWFQQSEPKKGTKQQIRRSRIAAIFSAVAVLEQWKQNFRDFRPGCGDECSIAE